MNKKTVSLMLISLLAIALFTGCNTKKETTESKNKTVNNVNEVDLEDNDKYDGKEACATRTHFKENVKSITYYSEGKEYSIKVDSAEGKEVISLMKQRIATCENLDKDTVTKNDEIKKEGKAVEVKFEKTAKNVFYNPSTEKNTEVEFDGLFMPLTGEYSQRLMLVPDKNGTFTISGKPEKLLNYLENNVRK